MTLARFTSLTVLIVFLLVNAALVALRWRTRGARPAGLVFPLWVPHAGAASSADLAVFEAVRLVVGD